MIGPEQGAEVGIEKTTEEKEIEAVIEKDINMTKTVKKRESTLPMSLEEEEERKRQ